jgi:hypothetical protein
VSLEFFLKCYYLAALSDGQFGGWCIDVYGVSVEDPKSDRSLGVAVAHTWMG